MIGYVILSSCSIETFVEIKNWHINGEDILEIYTFWYENVDLREVYVTVDDNKEKSEVYFTIHEDSEYSKLVLTIQVCADNDTAEEVCEQWKRENTISRNSKQCRLRILRSFNLKKS